MIVILGNNSDDNSILWMNVHNTTKLYSLKLLKWLHIVVNSSIQKAKTEGSQEASLSLKKKKKKIAKINFMSYTFYYKKNGAWGVSQW